MAKKPGITVDVQGLSQLKQGMFELADNIGETVGERLLRVANQAAADTRAKVPRQTGRLAGSVKAKLYKSERRASVRMGSAKVRYAGWMEFGGTRGRPFIPAGRYLFPSAQDAEPQLLRVSEQAATDEIRSMRWPTPR